MASKRRIYIDSCYYIDVARGRAVVAHDSAERADDVRYVETLLVAALNGDIEIISSTLTIAECLHAGDSSIITDEVKGSFRRILTSGQVVVLVAPDVFIAERARDLLWVDQIRCGGGADSIHVATALETNCEEFLTSNTKKGPGKAEAAMKLAQLNLRVIPATQTAVLPSKYLTPLLGP